MKMRNWKKKRKFSLWWLISEWGPKVRLSGTSENLEKSDLVLDLNLKTLDLDLNSDKLDLDLHSEKIRSRSKLRNIRSRARSKQEKFN